MIVRYDGGHYPGIIVDVDFEEIQVRCMHRIGVNRFFWPPMPDVCWYHKDNVMTSIPEPIKINDRHYAICPEIAEMLWGNWIDTAGFLGHSYE